MESVDVIVVGAGVVGLAIAAELAASGSEVVVCEKEKSAGTGISARNSGVIHAGLYYPPGSLKARLCVEGKQLLYSFCAEYGVAHKAVGKLVVATTAEECATLDALAVNARKNGVTDLTLLSKQAAQMREPELKAEAALYSPSSGIIDVGHLISALEAVLTSRGGCTAFATAVTHVVPDASGFQVTTSAGDTLHTRKLVNSAGLGAQSLAGSTESYTASLIPPRRLVRGNYFALSGASPFKTLVYPVPVAGGLGVHATLDIAGTLRFGPDVQPIEAEDYRPDETRETAFRAAIMRYYPGVEDRTLTADFVGIRPQTAALGTFADFLIAGEATHGMKGLINLFAIESPGLTSALAIARRVANMI